MDRKVYIDYTPGKGYADNRVGPYAIGPEQVAYFIDVHTKDCYILGLGDDKEEAAKTLGRLHRNNYDSEDIAELENRENYSIDFDPYDVGVQTMYVCVGCGFFKRTNHGHCDRCETTRILLDRIRKVNDA